MSLDVAGPRAESRMRRNTTVPYRLVIWNHFIRLSVGNFPNIWYRKLNLYWNWLVCFLPSALVRNSIVRFTFLRLYPWYPLYYETIWPRERSVSQPEVKPLGKSVRDQSFRRLSCTGSYILRLSFRRPTAAASQSDCLGSGSGFRSLSHWFSVFWTSGETKSKSSQ